MRETTKVQPRGPGNRRRFERKLSDHRGQVICHRVNHLDDGLEPTGLVNGRESAALLAHILPGVLVKHGVPKVSIQLQVGRDNALPGAQGVQTALDARCDLDVFEDCTWEGSTSRGYEQEQRATDNRSELVDGIPGPHDSAALAVGQFVVE